MHPWKGETQQNFTGPQPPFDLLDVNDKHTWLKAPRYNNQTMEVGPLARMVVAYAANDPPQVRDEVHNVLNALDVGPDALFSTLGRVAARGIETLLIAREMSQWIAQLEANMNAGNLEIHNGALWDPATWPNEATGWGTTEAPRGALGHWIRIKNGAIENYQMVVPSTWNGSPRDHLGQRGAWEEALIGTPIANIEQPVEILRTVHSFDPCMACAVHVVDANNHSLVEIQVIP